VLSDCETRALEMFSLQSVWSESIRVLSYGRPDDVPDRRGALTPNNHAIPSWLAEY